MSATDKLKALAANTELNYDETVTTGDLRVIDALPQIVAVVEAAEKYPFDPFSLDKLWLALAALDEALSPPTGGSP